MPSEVPDPMIGQLLGNYKITQKLGQGAMGLVYLAQHTTLNRPAAIKFLPEEFTEDKESVERFLKEARAAARLDHPHIVRVYDAGVLDDVYYCIMEYVKGRDLQFFLTAGQIFDEEDALQSVYETASAMAYAHQEGIIHRDLKPANLILTSENKIKVGDLGIAAIISEQTTTSTQIVGTAFYMSPEQIYGVKNVDAKTDIYALGATFFHLLTGKPPYEGDTIDEVLSKHLHDPVPKVRSFRKELSENTSQLIGKMLAKDPTQRLQSMHDVIAAIDWMREGRNKHSEMSDELDFDVIAMQRTMTLLHQSLKGKKDFPSLGTAMEVMNELAKVAQGGSTEDLAQAILEDFSLTNKLLKIVNSSFYSGYGEKISTISNAIMVLGLIQVRNAVVSLMLFDGAHGHMNSEEMKEISINNFLSGIIARNLAMKFGGIEPEEAFVCSVFHRLGKLLVTFFLPNEKKKIDEKVLGEKLQEAIAARSILGTSYEQLGINIATEWNFPDKILLTMKRFPRKKVPSAANPQEQLHRIVAFANETCMIFRDPNYTPESMEFAFQELINHYASCFSISTDDLHLVVAQSIRLLMDFAKEMGVEMKLD